MDNPKNTSSLLLIKNGFGGFCNRALVNLNVVLKTHRTAKINVNKNKLSKLFIISFFPFFQNFSS